MNKYRSVAIAKNPQMPAGSAVGPVQAWVRFWLRPTDPIGLHALRVLAGLLFICWLLPFAGEVQGLFGLQGWFDTQAYYDAHRIAEMDRPQPIGWSILYLCGSNATLLNVVYWAALAILAFFALGVFTRVTAVLSWIIVVSFTANPATAWDADALLIILAFYLMIGYVLLGQWNAKQSLFSRLLGSSDTWLFGRSSSQDSDRGSVAANVALRLLQVHFAIVMVTSGLHKLQFGEWWSGAAFWYPLHPPFSTTFEQARENAPNALTYLFFLSLAAYATLAWQIAFPLFAWRPRWRILLLGGAVVGWLGMIFIYDMPLFGPAICIGCVSYLTVPEWEWIRELLAKLPGLQWLRPQSVALQGELLKESINKEDSSSIIATRQR